MSKLRSTRGKRKAGRGGRTRTGIALIVVLALACAALVFGVVIRAQNDAARAAQEAAAYTPPPIVSASPTTGSVIAIVADDSGTRSATGVPASERWPKLVADELGVEVRTLGVSGGGYTVEGSRGRTFVDAAAEVPTNADVVVFVGGGADVGASSLAVGRAATRAFAAAKDRAPHATVVAVGPLFQPASASADELDTVTAALASSARITGADWIDPISADWLTGVDRVTDLDQQAEGDIGSQMSAVLREVLN